MKTDAEVEAEERINAEREVRRLAMRPAGFTPLAGKTRRQLQGQQNEEPAWLKGFVLGLVALCALPVSYFALGALGPVIGLLLLILVALGVLVARLRK